MSSGSRKKTFLAISLILFFLVLAFAGPFLLKDKKGKPFMSFKKMAAVLSLKTDSFLEMFKRKPKKNTKDPGTKNIEGEQYTPYANREYTEMYKYRDEKGVLHFTEQKPKGVKYETMYMPVSSVPKEKKEGFLKKMLSGKKKKETAKETPADKDYLSETKKMLKTVTEHYKKAPQTLQDAKNLKKQIEDSYEKRDKMIDEM